MGQWVGSGQITKNVINLASHMTNYDWPFGTLQFGLFGSNLDARDLETYPRTYSGHLRHMSIFDDSRAV